MAGNGNVNSVWADKRQLKKDITKIESSATGEVHKKDRYPVMSDLARHSVSMQTTITREAQVLGADRLRKYHVVQSQEDLESMEQEQATLDKNLEKLNEEAKKKSDREKDATARLGERHSYFEQSGGALLEARQLVIDEERSGLITARASGLTGDEFALEPEGGALNIPITDLLRKRMALKKAVEMHSRPELESGDAVIYARFNIELLAKLDEVLNLLYQANGVDFEKGKTVGSITRKRAKKKFALAMETYRDTLKNMEEYLCEAKIEEIKNSDAYKQKMKEKEKEHKQTGANLAESRENYRESDSHNGEGIIAFPNELKLPAIQQYEVVQMRDKFRMHEDKYRENKEVIDKLYKEWLDYLMKYANIQDKMSVLESLLFTNGNQLIGLAAKADTKIINGRMLKEAQAISGWLARIDAAISYFLEGEMPEKFTDHLFLYEHCGVATKVYEDASDKIALISKMREQGKTDGEICERLYLDDQMKEERQFEEGFQTELAELKKRKAALGRRTDPELDREIQKRENALRVVNTRTQCAFEAHNPQNIVIRRLMLENPENAEWFTKSREMANRVMGKNAEEKYTYKGESGKVENIYDRGVYHRDIFSNIAPIGRPGDCEMEDAIHYMDNIDILLKEKNSYIAKTLPDEDAYARCFDNAISEEDDLLYSAMNEMSEYMYDHGLMENISKRPPIDDVRLLYKSGQPLFEKAQGLGYRSRAVMKKEYFKEIEFDRQLNFLECAAFHTALFDWLISLQDHYSYRAQGEEEMVSDLVPFQDVMRRKKADFAKYTSRPELIRRSLG